MSENTTALAIAKDYPQNKYNLLIPVKTVQEISPLHKVVINEVQIDPNPANKDVYKEQGELALTKKGLMKLMAAANIQVIESKPIPTQRCNKCIEIAGRTRQAPKCFECPYIDDVAYQVTIAVPEPSGAFRMIKGTREIRMEDEKTKMTDVQFKRFKPFRAEQCESKALNRALRAGLMIKSSYTAEELKKPFAVALVMPNMSDPDLKAAMVERYANNANSLYGGGTSAPQMESIPQAPLQYALSDETIIIDSDSEIDYETGEIIDADIIEQETEELIEPEEEILLCSQCESEIMGFIDNSNTEWTPEQLAKYTAEKFNAQLCRDCLAKALKKSKKEGDK